jgi:hypothetical protein
MGKWEDGEMVAATGTMADKDEFFKMDTINKPINLC